VETESAPGDEHVAESGDAPQQQKGGFRPRDRRCERTWHGHRHKPERDKPGSGQRLVPNATGVAATVATNVTSEIAIPPAAGERSRS